MAGSKEPDFVGNAPNTCPNLCDPLHQHARQEEGKYKKGERAEAGGCVRLMSVGGGVGSGGGAWNATEEEEFFPLELLAVT